MTLLRDLQPSRTLRRIRERMHQTVANILRTTIPLQPPRNKAEAQQLAENAIATAVYATRVSVSRSLGTSPGNLAFRRDMLMDVQLTADFLTIRDQRQQLIDVSLMKQNQKRRNFDYQVGMKTNHLLGLEFGL